MRSIDGGLALWCVLGLWWSSPGAKARLLCLKQLRPTVTVHGFRSTFRDWAGDFTDYSREICEAVLSRAVLNPIAARLRFRSARR